MLVLRWRLTYFRTSLRGSTWGLGGKLEILLKNRLIPTMNIFPNIVRLANFRGIMSRIVMCFILSYIKRKKKRQKRQRTKLEENNNN